MKKIWVCLIAAFVLLSFNQIQEKVITGKVISSEDGSELPGVNVILKGTTTGTVTNATGNYKITVPASGGTLVFSFIGLQTLEIKIGSASVINVQMDQDVAQLSETIVTAHGMQKTKRSAGKPKNKMGDAAAP